MTRNGGGPAPSPEVSNLTTHMEPSLTHDQERFMRWMEAGDVTGHDAAAADVPAEWLALREEAARLGDAMRAVIPPEIEPPAARDFNAEILRRLC